MFHGALHRHSDILPLPGPQCDRTCLWDWAIRKNVEGLHLLWRKYGQISVHCVEKLHSRLCVEYWAAYYSFTLFESNLSQHNVCFPSSADACHLWLINGSRTPCGHHHTTYRTCYCMFSSDLYHLTPQYLHSFKKTTTFFFLSFINFTEQETGKQVKSEHGSHEPKGLRTQPKPPHLALRHVGARSTPQPKYPTPFILDLCSFFSCEILINWSVQLV